MQKTASSVSEARNWFAQDVRAAAPVHHNLAIVEAFAKVPREHYLGDGPWFIQPRMLDRPKYMSPTAEPHHVYHDVLVSFDQARELNNGLSSLWAFYFDQLRITPGQTILQVGAGVGYFTAILAELVTPQGRVVAYEVDEALASRAAANLDAYPNVEVICGDATQATDLPLFDVGVVFAGATHVPTTWLSSLSPSGRITIPITGDDQWGFMLLLENEQDKVYPSSLGACGFYHCAGARTAHEAKSLGKALESSDRAVPHLDQLLLGQPPAGDDSAWYVGDGFWLSKEACATRR